MKKLDRSIFIKELKESFPELRESINQEYGILNLEVSVFYDYVQDQIDNENKAKLIECFQLIEKYITEGNSNLLNSLGVSLIEHLNFKDGKCSREWAKPLMLKNSTLAYESLKNYHGN